MISALSCRLAINNLKITVTITSSKAIRHHLAIAKICWTKKTRNSLVGLQELCGSNFGNFDGSQYSRINPE